MKAPILKSLILSFVVIFFYSCAQDTHKSTEKPAKIGLSFGPTDGRWSKDRDYLVENLKAKGVEVSVRQANEDPEQQLKDLDDLMEENVDAMIVIAIDGKAISGKIQEIRQNGIKVLAYDRMIPDCNVDFYVSFDNQKVGEMQADYLTRIVPKGNYMVLGGSPNDYNSKFLRLGQMNILQPLMTKGDIDIVLEENVENWDSELAYQIVNDYLNRNKAQIDAIVASSDDLSKGAILALEEHGIAGKVMVSGQDAQEDACRRILEGKQIMTVYKIIESLAHTASNVAVALAKNQPIPNSHLTVNNGKMMVPSILLPSMISVNKENLRTTVVADGYIDESKVYDRQVVKN